MLFILFLQAPELIFSSLLSLTKKWSSFIEARAWIFITVYFSKRWGIFLDQTCQEQFLEHRGESTFRHEATYDENPFLCVSLPDIDPADHRLKHCHYHHDKNWQWSGKSTAANPIDVFCWQHHALTKNYQYKLDALATWIIIWVTKRKQTRNLNQEFIFVLLACNHVRQETQTPSPDQQS